MDIAKVLMIKFHGTRPSGKNFLPSSLCLPTSCIPILCIPHINYSDEEMGPLDLMHMLREIRNKEKRINRTLDSFKANVNDTLIQSQSIEAVRLSTELCFRMAGLILDSNDVNA
ncbi:hypothetical protein L3Y34_016992 [Caenorhabditis briggsae]|uniref:Uncharacterized protein n=1 Tax=Caenorhabditis briggsae TaxID=6238 RepID=A0AAE9DH16_CAEBR|nr:hypothetical protein L3Y34_016992 [Caenorhabditis briggsae]